MHTFTIKIERSGDPVKGPDQVLSTVQPVEFLIESDPDNQATCYFSDSPKPREDGFALTPGDRIPIKTVNFSHIYFDAAGPAIIRVLQPGA
jgi:hypothetical protein